MTVEEKMWKLAQLLRQKTERGQLDWEQAPGRNSFQAAFPKYAVKIQQDADDDYTISVFNEEGNLVEKASAVEIIRSVSGSNAYPAMEDLYLMARRKALGVDAALDGLLAELESDVPF